MDSLAASINQLSTILSVKLGGNDSNKTAWQKTPLQILLRGSFSMYPYFFSFHFPIINTQNFNLFSNSTKNFLFKAYIIAEIKILRYTGGK
jgi:hypothetical protein